MFSCEVYEVIKAKHFSNACCDRQDFLWSGLPHPSFPSWSVTCQQRKFRTQLELSVEDATCHQHPVTAPSPLHQPQQRHTAPRWLQHLGSSPPCAGSAAGRAAGDTALQGPAQHPQPVPTLPAALHTNQHPTLTPLGFVRASHNPSSLEPKHGAILVCRAASRTASWECPTKERVREEQTSLASQGSSLPFRIAFLISANLPARSPKGSWISTGRGSWVQPHCSSTAPSQEQLKLPGTRDRTSRQCGTPTAGRRTKQYYLLPG